MKRRNPLTMGQFIALKNCYDGDPFKAILGGGHVKARRKTLDALQRYGLLDENNQPTRAGRDEIEMRKQRRRA